MSAERLERISKVLSAVLVEVYREDTEHGEERHLEFCPGPTGLAVAGEDSADTDWSWGEVLAYYRRGNDGDPEFLSWITILMEEVAEVACAEDEENLVKELVQVAAVAVRWARAVLNRNTSQEER